MLTGKNFRVFVDDKKVPAAKFVNFYVGAATKAEVYFSAYELDAIGRVKKTKLSDDLLPPGDNSVRYRPNIKRYCGNVKEIFIDDEGKVCINCMDVQELEFGQEPKASEEFDFREEG